ncbi:MAG: energy transducer TonB [Bacteroidota bacterium]
MNDLVNCCLAALLLSCLCVGSCVTDSGMEEAASAPAIYEMIEVDQEPTPLNMAEVQRRIGYPKDAKRHKIQGKVITRVLVGEEGEYLQHEVLMDDNPILMEGINQEIQHLTFSPAMKEGKSVKAWVNIPFEFKFIDKPVDSAIFQALNYFEVSEKIGYPTVENGPQVEGRVLLRIQVDAAGKYLSHEVLEEGHPVLLAGVEPYVGELVFSPNEQGESYTVDLPFEYGLLK